MINDGFAANCQHCGELQPARLLDDPAPCEFCSAEDPLTDEQRIALAERGSAVRAGAAMGQRNAERRDATAAEFGAMMAAFGGLSWVFFALVGVSSAFSEVPPTLTAKALMKLKQTAHGDTAEMAVVMAWWMLFGFALTAALSLCATFFTLFLLKKPAKLPFALAPRSEGAPPRCPACGSGLTGRDATRACPACGTQCTVAKTTAVHDGPTLDEQLAKIERASIPALTAASRAPYAIVALFASAPALIMLAQQFKITGTHRTRPELVPVIWALFAVAATLCLLWLSRWGSRARSLREARIGDGVLVQGHRYTVRGRLHAARDASVGTQTLTLLAPQDPDHRAMIALDLQVEPRDARVIALEVHEGGVPFEPAPKGASEPSRIEYALEERGGETSLIAVTGPSVRWFNGPPANGGEPRWTTQAMELSLSDVVLLSTRG